MGIPELNKPKDEWCPNFARGRGCSIYPNRPASCRAFSCHWLLDPSMGPEWKPNKCKMVIDAMEMTLVVHVDPGTNRPWQKEPYFSQLLTMAERGIARGAMVVVMERKHSILILPDRGVDLGILTDDDRIGIAEVMTSTGPRWVPRIVKAEEANSLGATGKGWVDVSKVTKERG
jgi:hypothetical protein